MPILMSILESLLQALPRIEIRYRHPFKESDHVRPAYRILDVLINMN